MVVFRFNFKYFLYSGRGEQYLIFRLTWEDGMADKGWPFRSVPDNIRNG